MSSIPTKIDLHTQMCGKHVVHTPSDTVAYPLLVETCSRACMTIETQINSPSKERETITTKDKRVIHDATRSPRFYFSHSSQAGKPVGKDLRATRGLIPQSQSAPRAEAKQIARKG